LRAILLRVNEGNVILDETSKALDAQIEQLARMENTVKDTRSVLNRSQKYLRYFARQIYTDKLLMTLICLIAVVVVTIIICSVAGYDMKKIKDQII
jgi:novel plant SNARE